MTGKRVRSQNCGLPAVARGFSLIELIVAMAVFLIVSGAAFTLFNQHQILLSQQQGLAGLNIGLRNALTQIQLDAANAGDGLVIGPWSQTSWPLGVTINNQIPGSACNTPATMQYGPKCFDTLSVYMADPNACSPSVQVCNPTAAFNTNTSSTVIIAPATGSLSPSTFQAGDTLLVVKSSGSAFQTITLTQAGQASGSDVRLTFTSSTCTGSPCEYVNPSDALPATPPPPLTGGLLITTTTATANEAEGVTTLTNSFTTTDLVIHMVPITYYVDTTTNPNDPTLKRQVAGGTPSIVMDQVVSFKVGAALVGDDTGNYYYNAAVTASGYATPAASLAAAETNGGYDDDFTQIRSIRVNLMARTAFNPTSTYRNLFDGGPYQVLGSSVVVNPRNLSMNDP